MKREEVVALDKARVWHPYTPMRQYVEETAPLVIERAEGARIFDVDGRSYVDGNASWWVALLGHRHPRLLRALREQSERMTHVSLAGITHEPAARLAEELCAVAPAGLSRVFFSDDGSTAVEVALKLALQLWFNHGRPEKRRLVGLEGAFHGDTLGATAVGGVEVFRRPFAASAAASAHLPVPGAGIDLDGATAALGETLAAGDVAALIVEPCAQGAAGMRLYDPAFLVAARRLCDAHDVLLVFDEVFTGYGRTGPMWAADHAGVRPDILCTAKGFTAGVLPMAATLVTERVFEAFLGDRERAFYYGHTYCGHPLGAAVAREVLAIYRDEAILERAAPKAERIAATFARLGEIPGLERPRALGMIGAIDIVGDGGYLSRAGWRVYDEALSRGAYLRPLGNTVYVTPPLNIDDGDLDELLSVLEESVRRAL